MKRGIGHIARQWRRSLGMRLFFGALLGGVFAPGVLSLSAQASEVPAGPYYDGGFLDAGIPAATAPPVSAAPQVHPPVNGVALRRAVDVNGPFITLGDLFEGLGTKTDVVVARSPQPGRQAVLNAQWLDQAAQTHALTWRPNSSLVQVVVNRPGQVVPPRDIEAALRPALQNLGAPPHLTLELNGPARSSLIVPWGAPIQIRVSGETYDPQTRRFTAMLEAPAGTPDAQRVQVSGVLTDTRDVPVLSRRLSRGQVITPEDIDFVPMKVESLPSGVITSVEDLIGKEPRNTVREGEPVRRSEILRPEVVRRNAIVTMYLSMPGINVTARGRALEAGSDGDLIRVMNLASKQVVLGTVLDASRVEVAAPPEGLPQSASR